MDPTTGLAGMDATSGPAGIWRVARVADTVGLADATARLADATYGVDAAGSLLGSGSQLWPLESANSSYPGTSTTSS